MFTLPLDTEAENLQLGMMKYATWINRHFDVMLNKS